MKFSILTTAINKPFLFEGICTKRFYSLNDNLFSTIQAVSYILVTNGIKLQITALFCFVYYFFLRIKTLAVVTTVRLRIKPGSVCRLAKISVQMTILIAFYAITIYNQPLLLLRPHLPQSITPSIAYDAYDD